jgi:hypothetical protein
MLAMLREGKASSACRYVHEQLRVGKGRAGTVWDAVFLATSELSIRYHMGGPSGRARHAVTMTNALHYAFRTLTDPGVRLYSLLEAVEWTCAFLSTESKLNQLTDRWITQIAEVDSPESAKDALDEIFSGLPPRRSHHWFRDRSGQEKGMRLAYAFARKHPDHQPFFQTARRLICAKATVDPHDFKLPVAFFENYAHASPEWRPHLLAASVFQLHGTKMEDSPAFREAQEALRRR